MIEHAVLIAATVTGLVTFGLGAVYGTISLWLWAIGKISDAIHTTHLLLAAVSLVVRDRERARKEQGRVWPEEYRPTKDEMRSGL